MSSVKVKAIHRIEGPKGKTIPAGEEGKLDKKEAEEMEAAGAVVILSGGGGSKQAGGGKQSGGKESEEEAKWRQELFDRAAELNVKVAPATGTEKLEAIVAEAEKQAKEGKG